MSPRAKLARLAGKIPSTEDKKLYPNIFNCTKLDFFFDVSLTGWPSEKLDFDPETDLPLLTKDAVNKVVTQEEWRLQNMLKSELALKEKITAQLRTLQTTAQKISESESPGGHNTGVPLLDQLKYKYCFHDNVSTRDIWCLLAGQVIFRAHFRYDSIVDNGNIFTPYEDWIPLRRDLSDFEEKLDFLVGNDNWAKKIADRAREKSRQVFDLDTNYWYMHTLALKLGLMQSTLQEGDLERH